MNFDFDSVEAVAFGVGIRSGKNVSFHEVPVDRAFAQILVEMGALTWAKMIEISESPSPYDPANSLGGSHHLVVAINEPMAEIFGEILNADQFPPGGSILRDPKRVFCYFGRFVNDQDDRLVGMRRSSTFKNLVKQRNRIARLVDDTLHLEADSMFRVDNEFDLLIDSDEIRILHPLGFESIGQLGDEIRAAVPDNVTALRQNLDFVDLGAIEEVAAGNLRVARLLASAVSVGTTGITFDSLRRYCEETSVQVQVANGRIIIGEDKVVDFLNALTRRRLSATLVPGEREVYHAPRSKPGMNARRQIPQPR